MKHDLELKLMSLLDGELSAAEARVVENLAAGDREAAALLAELRQTRFLLTANEPEARLPISREMNWNRIQLEIDRLEVTPTTETSSLWQRLSAVVRRHVGGFAGAGVGVAAALALVLTQYPNPTAVDLFEEVDNPIGDGGAFSFRSEENGATLVWITSPSGNEEESGASEDEEPN